MLTSRLAMCCCIPLTRSPCQVLSATPGSCGRWRVENVSVQDAAAEPAKRVTLMYFERCAPELGATVVLRGGNEDELKGLKRLLASASYAAADLNAEAAYVYDFGGTMQPVTAALPAAPAPPGDPSAKHRTAVRRATELSVEFVLGRLPKKAASTTDRRAESQGAEAVPLASGCTASSAATTRTEESAQVTGPDAATVEVETIAPNRAREASQLSGASEAALEWVRQPGYAAESSFARSWSGREQPEADESFLGADDTGDSPWQGHSTAKSADVQAQSTGFSADVETASRSGMARHSTFSLPRPWAEEVHAIRVATCWKRWDVCEPPCQVPRERTLPYHLRLMDPAACVQPDDCLTLGQFLQTCCFNLRRQCTNPKCREGVKLHEQCFSHHGSRLSIRVLQLPAEHARPAEEGLFAWSVCRACPQPARAGPRVPLSAQTCTLSFGRFLESNFSNLTACSRFSGCSHPLHPHHERFISYGALVCALRVQRCVVFDMTPPPAPRPRAAVDAEPGGTRRTSWTSGNPRDAKPAVPSPSNIVALALGSSLASEDVLRACAGVGLSKATPEQLLEVMRSADATSKLEIRYDTGPEREAEATAACGGTLQPTRVTLVYPAPFAALRQRVCEGGDAAFTESLRTSAPWDSGRGGKSGSTFLKTSDGRYLLKQVRGRHLDPNCQDARISTRGWRDGRYRNPSSGLSMTTLASTSRSCPARRASCPRCSSRSSARLSSSSALPTQPRHR